LTAGIGGRAWRGGIGRAGGAIGVFFVCGAVPCSCGDSLNEYCTVTLYVSTPPRAGRRSIANRWRRAWRRDDSWRRQVALYRRKRFNGWWANQARHAAEWA